MFLHGRVTLGAVVATMLATAGDESFFMLAVIPQQVPLLALSVAPVALLGGFLTDRFSLGRFIPDSVCSAGLQIHEADQSTQEKFSLRNVLQWKPRRVAFIGVFLVLLVGALTSWFGMEDHQWIRYVGGSAFALGLAVSATASEHFFSAHIWKHVVRSHALRIFLWTLAALVVTHLVLHRFNLREMLDGQQWVVLAIAAAIGLIPESGPHMVFVSLFAQGALPFSILLANTLIQDGHAMLPLLAESRRAFLLVKLINLVIGLTVGAALLALGW
jgi:hypothetical protein